MCKGGGTGTHGGGGTRGTAEVVPMILAMLAEPIPQRTPLVAAGEVVWTSLASWLQWHPGPQGTRWQQGLWRHRKSYAGACSSSPAAHSTRTCVPWMQQRLPTLAHAESLWPRQRRTWGKCWPFWSPGSNASDSNNTGRIEGTSDPGGTGDTSSRGSGGWKVLSI